MTDVADPKLCSLLENEYYLAKVLKHVVDDGLHECRRVRRKWRDVCGRLPVELVVIDEAFLPLACETFPNATSVTSGTPSDNYEIVDQLAGLEHLRHLEIFPHLEDEPETRSAVLNTFPRSFEKLETLSLWFSDELFLVDLGSSLQCLTNITKLKLRIYGNVRLQMEPITQLSKLKNLRLYSVPLENEEGELMFQPLTGLTSLSLSPLHQTARMQDRMLQIVQREARQLQHFDLWWDRTNSQEDPNLTILSTFSHMKSLELRQDSGPSFRRVLTNMCWLTRLAISCQYGHQHEDWDSVLSLTGLRSLSFSGQSALPGDVSFVLHSFHRLSLLTSLTTESVNPGITLCWLTGLVELKLLWLQCNLTDVQHAFVYLSNLERFYCHHLHRIRSRLKAALSCT